MALRPGTSITGHPQSQLRRTKDLDCGILCPRCYVREKRDPLSSRRGGRRCHLVWDLIGPTQQSCVGYRQVSGPISHGPYLRFTEGRESPTAG